MAVSTFVTLLITLPPEVTRCCTDLAGAGGWPRSCPAVLGAEPAGTTPRWRSGGGTCRFSAPCSCLGSNAWLLHSLFWNNFEKKPVREMQNNQYFNTAPEIFI